MLDEQHLGNVFRGELVGKPGDAFANHQSAHRAGGMLRKLLRSGERLEAGVVPLSLAVFGDDQDFHIKSPVLQTSAATPVLRLLPWADPTGIASSSSSWARRFFPRAVSARRKLRAIRA